MYQDIVFDINELLHKYRNNDEVAKELNKLSSELAISYDNEIIIECLMGILKKNIYTS